MARFCTHSASLLLLSLLVLSPPGEAGESASAFLAWFTDGEFDEAARSPTPEPALPGVPGTAGMGVRLTREIALDVPLLSKGCGSIGFWIKPAWNGDDGKNHRLLRIGQPGNHGLLIEKSDLGMLRFSMATPAKVTASRADVSRWRAGEWHHVVAAWMSRDGRPIGLPLFIDRVAVDGPVAGGDCFPDPATLPDRRVYVGHETTGAVMDELVFQAPAYDQALSGAPRTRVPGLLPDCTGLDRIRDRPCTHCGWPRTAEWSADTRSSSD